MLIVSVYIRKKISNFFFNFIRFSCNIKNPLPKSFSTITTISHKEVNQAFICLFSLDSAPGRPANEDLGEVDRIHRLLDQSSNLT